ncbi:glycosyltransferase [Aliarcobacter butzleri]|uniref:glycosyltransferase n=1 Tax=Aliarcobacter butzleri TaxID=28197 RepID=UPI003B223542
MDVKKIVILINSLESGGAERVVSNLLNTWVKRYDCYLILIHDYKFYDIDSRVNILNLNEQKNLSGIKKFLRLPILAYKLSKLIKEYKFDKVISFLTRANYINVLSNIFIKHKIIINERAMPSLQYQYGLNGKINKFLIKFLYQKADLCLSNSYGNMMDLKNNFNLMNVHYVHNLFNLDMVEEFSKDEIEIEKRRFTFVTIGRLDRGKNHKLLIDAIKEIDADLWIIGDGELKEKLQTYISELSLCSKVYLLGKKENPFSYISKCDCFVFSSNHEGFPNVLIEALICKLPIISTDCKSGPREILSSNTDLNFNLINNIELGEYGILVPIKNVEKMKEAMNLIIDDDNLRKDYEEKAKNRANDFRIEKIIKQYENIISV